MQVSRCTRPNRPLTPHCSVFKELLLESPPWIAWAVTGGNMATVWANVVATPVSGVRCDP